MSESKTIEEIIKQLKNEMSKIDEDRLYYTFKAYYRKRITERGMLYLKAILCLHNRGIPITNEIISCLVERNIIGTNIELHRFGDLRVLTIARSWNKENRWYLSEEFIKHFLSSEEEVVE